ncbi:MAG: sodium/solute symporter [Pseudomonadales bacterium]|jgi:SSS family solute:Na+ symporter|nr:sodium/solute symporter [Pseudomonadales bacterium]
MNGVHPVDLAIMVGYLLLITGVGVSLARRIHDARDYFLAGRSLGWGIIGLSIIGTNVSAESYVGAAGGAWKVGLAQANFEWIGAIPAMILASLVFVPVYWRAGVYSIPEYMGLRFGQPVRVLTAGIASLFSVFVIAVSMFAISITLETYLGWPMWVGILVTGGVVGTYSISGGLAAVAFTDALQVVIMFLGGIAIFALGMSETGGFGAFTERLIGDNPDHLSAWLPGDHPEFPWFGVLLGLGFVLSPAYWCGGQTILQRTLGARSEWDAKASMMFAAFAKTFVPLLIVFPGLLALALHAQIEYPDMALPWVVKELLPPGLSGLMFIAIVAALQSSLDSSLNSTALMITRDIRGVLFPQRDTSKDLRVGRLFTLAILVVGMACAPLIGDLGGIFLAVQLLLSLFQGPTLALLVVGVATRWATPRAGLATIVLGVPFAGLLTALGWNMLYVAFTSFVVALVLLVLVSRVSEPLPAELLDRLTFRGPRAGETPDA